jgi:large subunit ribosomal protein L15
MPHKLRKIRKKRGSRTVGYGRIGQHRGVGQRGGHGKAGRRKHLWSYILRYEPDYFEKKGFIPHRRSEPSTINVGEVDEEVHQLLDVGEAIKKGDGIHIDLKTLGYDKLLGGGKVTHPLFLSVDSFSKSAAKKIKMAEGSILQTKESILQTSSTDEKQEVSQVEVEVNLTDVKGIGQKRTKKLQEIGINSVKALAECKIEDISEKAGISEKIVSKWIKYANELLSAK